uniref:serine hydrolase domain-containing protein n=1 Tax=Paractinoplanes polyasparticus TaxID=2856853 RepID=UPI001C84F7E7
MLKVLTLTRRRVLVSLVALGGLTVGSGLSASASPASHGPRDAVQRSLDSLVSVDNFPGALASVRQADGRVRNYTAGVGNLKTEEKMPVSSRIRIASNTKMFTATVVLQLVGEGKVELDEPIETYLPGLVRGAGGIDGRQITVRQLLQQTSGLLDYDDEVYADFVNSLQTYHEPHDLLRIAFAKAPQSRPGERFGYANTNYILAGLLVQKITGRPVGEQITERIIEPLRLRHTYWPADGDTAIRGIHPRGYFPGVEGNDPIDITRSEPSGGWAAGALIGSTSDINVFLAGLLGGKLLKPAELAEMKKTVDAPGFDTVGGSRYGLGIATFNLSCGGFAWTHGGVAPGYVTYVGVAPSGRAASIAVNSMISEISAVEHLEQSLDTALCR